MPSSLHSHRYRSLVAALVEARRAAGITQEKVALALSKPQSYVAKYEKAERRLDVVEFLDIARVIGFDPCEFLRRFEN